MSFQFTKMQALGNNYIYVNQFKEQLDEHSLASLARKVSSVQTGIGSDGLILIAPSEVGAIKMRVFNSDGSEAKNCGNGLRCVAKYAYERGLVKEKKFAIETSAGLVEAEVFIENDDVYLVTIDMGMPGITKGSLPMLGSASDSSVDCLVEIDGVSYSFVGVSMGNPHAVLFVDDIEQAPVTTIGPVLEKHELFPEWVNVEFIHVLSGKEIDFRVWERGSGITYACGTGACAAVVAAILKGKAAKDDLITVHLLGGDLQIKWSNDGHVWMTGPAEYVCDGVFYN
jgi:diaminopimelate epimerase